MAFLRPAPLAMPQPRPMKFIENLDGLTSLYSLRDRLCHCQAYDEVNENHGQYNGAVSVPEGVSFDGVDDYVRVSYNTDFNVLKNNKPFTILAGFKLDVLPSTKGANEVIISQQDGLGTGRTWISVISSNDQIATAIGGVSFVYISPAISVDTWYLVGIRYDGSTLRTYYNDIYYSSATKTVDESADGDFIFGAPKGLAGQWLDGTINFISTFKRELARHELTEVYEWYRAMIV